MERAKNKPPTPKGEDAVSATLRELSVIGNNINK